MKKALLLIIVMAMSLMIPGCDKHEAELADIRSQIENLQAQVDAINSSIEVLQNLIAAVQAQDYVTEVKNVYQGYDLIGYVIYFLHSAPITIYNGEDGRDGKRGEDGKDGSHGKDGKDATAPIIGIQKASDGIWYWTVNGEWLLDDYNQKFPVYGEPAVTPQFKISDSKWYVSYDEGRTWNYLAPVSGCVDSIFRTINDNGDYYSIRFSDGTYLNVPKYKGISIMITEGGEMKVTPGSVVKLHYTIEGSVGNNEIGFMANGGIVASVSQTDMDRGTINVQIPSPFSGGTLTVFVNNMSNVISKTIEFKI